MTVVPHHAARLLSASLGLGLALAAPLASAHAYWLAPQPLQAAVGERVGVSLLVGELAGSTELPWLTYQIHRFQVATPTGIADAESMDGNLPAYAFVGQSPGLYVLAQETNPLMVSFDSMAKFRDYLDYEGLGQIADEHLRRGLPQTGFKEAYRRAAKALVQVGAPRPGEADRAMGMPYELVALQNPYGGADRVTVQLLWQSKPAAHAPVAVSNSGAPQDRRLLMTDAEGKLEVPLAPDTRYLLNAVHIEPVEGQENVWLSIWASLMF